MTSVWAMSLLAQLSQARSTLELEKASGPVRDMIGRIQRGYLIASPVANQVSDPHVFAFQENNGMSALCQDLNSSPESEAFGQVIDFRRGFDQPGELSTRLAKIRDGELVEQQLTLLFLKEAMFSVAEHDDVVGSWLQLADEVSQTLLLLGDSQLELLLEALSEFHLRQSADWAVRLPHILAYTIEQSDNEARVGRLFSSILFMSINAGIASPIQRVLSSKWRPQLLQTITTWRENLVTVGAFSEPWVVGRIRATSSAVSRLIGPRDARQSVQDSGHGQ